MSKAQAVSLLLTLALLLGACQSEPVGSALTAALSELQGRVDIKPAASDSFTPASSESVLEVSGQVQTGDDGRVRLDLSTGTIVRVAPSSLFTLTSNETVDGGLATRIKLELGQVFIILNGGSAEIETPSGVASVRGSYLQVSIDPDTGDVLVTCLEGDCGASNGAGSVNFTDGQKVILYFSDTGEWALPEIENMTPEEIEAWLNNNPEAGAIIEELFQQQNPAEPPPPPPPPPPPAPSGDAGDGGDTCFNLLEPPPGAELPWQGRVEFTWEPQDGASYYMVTFTDSEGNTVSLRADEPGLSKYIEILPDAGSYSWGVTAYGEDGAEICTAEGGVFSKPDSNWQPENPKEKGKDAPYCDPFDCEGSCPDPDYCN